LPALADAVHAHGARLYALTPRRPDLETMFLELIEDTPEAARPVPEVTRA
jgi:ABC-2 type transport system ATP-binding protein